MMGVRRAIRKLRRVLFGPRNVTEIDRVTAALERHDAKVDSFVTERGDCCAACKYGDWYTDAAEKAERTRYWLCVLLCRRGRPEDMRKVKSLMFELSPELHEPLERLIARQKPVCLPVDGLGTDGAEK